MYQGQTQNHDLEVHEEHCTHLPLSALYSRVQSVEYIQLIRLKGNHCKCEKILLVCCNCESKI